MTTTREQQLAFCNICTNRKFHKEKGLLCGLSDDYASFQDTCPDFALDGVQEKRSLQLSLRNAGHDGASRSLDFKKNKENGLLIGTIGAILFVVCLLYFNGILPLFLSGSVLVYGIRTYNRGMTQQQILEKKKEFDEKHLNKG